MELYVFAQLYFNDPNCILVLQSCDITASPSSLRKRNQLGGSKYLSSRYHHRSLLEHPPLIMVEWSLAHAPLPIARLATAKSRPACSTFRDSLGLSPRGTTGWQLTPVWQCAVLCHCWEPRERAGLPLLGRRDAFVLFLLSHSRSLLSAGLISSLWIAHFAPYLSFSSPTWNIYFFLFHYNLIRCSFANPLSFSNVFSIKVYNASI